MIEIYHLIYWREGGNKPQYGRISHRKNWDFRKKKQKKYVSTLWLPNPFEELLDQKYNQYFYVPYIKNSKDFLEFTVGYDKEASLYAIAIRHPFDPKVKSFKKQIGRDIVTGRIKRMKGELKGREPYDLNKFFLVYKEE